MLIRLAEMETLKVAPTIHEITLKQTKVKSIYGGFYSFGITV